MHGVENYTSRHKSYRNLAAEVWERGNNLTFLLVYKSNLLNLSHYDLKGYGLKYKDPFILHYDNFTSRKGLVSYTRASLGVRRARINGMLSLILLCDHPIWLSLTHEVMRKEAAGRWTVQPTGSSSGLWWSVCGAQIKLFWAESIRVNWLDLIKSLFQKRI